MGHRLSRRRAAALALLTVRVAGMWARARGIAVFRCRRDGISLLASNRLAQESIDYVRGLWTEGFAAVAKGNVHVDTARSGGRLHLVIPCLSGRRMRGLLYADVPAASGPPLDALHALGAVAGAILGRRHKPGAIPRALITPHRVPAEVVAEAANLRAMLQLHEWNVSRVARVLGVPCMTIYNRLRRLKVRREHVRRSAPRARRPRQPQGEMADVGVKSTRGAA